MEHPVVPPKHRPRWLVTTIVLILAFDLAFAWQHLGRAYSSEFGGHPDEAAHYLNGLLVHDYAVRGFGTAPAKFAETFRRSYPSSGPGLWPPLFPLVQAAWTLPFGTSRTSVLLLMCVLTAIVAFQLFRALRDEFGTGAAAIAAALFLSLSFVREYSAMIMPEMLCAVLMFGAALALGRYLDSEKPAAALCFGLLAALAILTKTSGLALLLMVPLPLLLTGKWFLLARPALWAGIALPALIAGPWVWRFRKQGGFLGDWIQPAPSLDFAREALPFYVVKFSAGVGIVVAVLMFIGLAVKLLRPSERTGRWAAAAALIASVILFQAILPVSLEPRHVIPAIPAAMMFAVAGWSAVASRFRRGDSVGTPVSAAVTELILPLLLIVMWLSSVAIGALTHRKGWTGFRPLAEIVLADTSGSKGSVLVASDRTGEGMFVSEIAMAEKRPGRTIELASRVLVDSAAGNRRPRGKFTDDEDLAEFLKTGEFQYIVFDDSLTDEEPRPYQDMLKRVLRDDTEHFWEVAASPLLRAGISQDTPVRIYRVLGRK
jgi:hypothetical protein